jgi:hypothetical protein
VREALRKGAFDLVVIDHTQSAWLVDFIPETVPIAAILHNAESELYLHQSELQAAPIRRFLYRRESRRLSRLDHTIESSAARIWLLNEADLVAVPKARRKAVVLPVIPAAGDVRPLRSKFDVGLLGTWSWLPNADGLRWFFNQVYSRLPSDVSIQIAGAGAEQIGGRRPNVTYRGFVQDASAFMRSGKAFAIPTRFGSGLESKTLMAIQSGAAVVGTSVSARGLGEPPGSVSIADDPDSFASALVSAVRREPRQSARNEALRWCESRRLAFFNVLRGEIHCLCEAGDVPLKRAPSLPSGFYDAV